MKICANCRKQINGGLKYSNLYFCSYECRCEYRDNEIFDDFINFLEVNLTPEEKEKLQKLEEIEEKEKN